MTEPTMPTPEVPPPGSGSATTITTTTEARTSTPFSRKVEDGAFIVAIVLVSLWGLVAIAKSASLLPQTPDQAFPWELVILVSSLIVPKTIGRATAGRIWDKLPGRGN